MEIKETEIIAELHAQCACCGNVGAYPLTQEALDKVFDYLDQMPAFGQVHPMGYVQDVFPDVPSWIRAACLSKGTDGFCICPKCSGFDEAEQDEEALAAEKEAYEEFLLTQKIEKGSCYDCPLGNGEGGCTAPSCEYQEMSWTEERGDDDE